MYHTPALGTPFFRVTDRKQRAPLSGRGAYYNLGGRYNSVHQRTVYAADDPLVAITEGAYYQALHWQEKIGGLPFVLARSPQPKFPFKSPLRLWCFKMHASPRLIDLDHAAAYQVFQHQPHQLLNPGQFYETTEKLANIVRAHGTPRPQGIKAPSVRVPRSDDYQPYQFALFVFKQNLAGQVVWRADLTLEFLDRQGDPVTAQTRDVDWCVPAFI